MNGGVVTTAPTRWVELVASIAGMGILLSDTTAPGSELPERAAVQREFPHVRWLRGAVAPPSAVLIDEADWSSADSDLYDWDACVLALQAGRGWLLVSSARGAALAADALLQVLTRYQRLVPRVNAASSDDSFRCAISLHRSLHDLTKPLVRADYEHALDVWQWLLRLEPAASRALQLAALFHDIERISSEADARVEQLASDYQTFKNAHAWLGAQLAARMLESAGIASSVCARVAQLIWQHELPSAAGADPELRLLGDADALSFFSLNSRGFFDHYGLEHTRKKVRYSLGRMSPRALSRLRQIKLPPEVARLVREAVQGTRASLQPGAPS